MTFTRMYRTLFQRCLFARRSVLAFLLVLTAALLLLQQAARASQPAHLIVGGKEALFVVPPFVGDDGQVYAPADFVRLLGADYALDPAHQCLKITAADGRTFEQDYKVADQRFMIPVESVAAQLGATPDWDAARHAMTLRARILMVREDHNTLTIATSYPVYYRVDSLDSPARLFVDVFGALLPAAPAAIPARGDNLLRIRSGQLDSSTVRLVLDLRHSIHYQVAATMQTDSIEVALNTARTSTGYVPLPLAGSTQIASEDTQSQDTPSGSDGDTTDSGQSQSPASSDTGQPQTSSTQPPTGDFKITNIEFKNDTGSTQVIVSTVGAAPGGPSAYRAFLLNDPDRLAVDLPGAGLALTGDLATDADARLPVTSPDITDIRWGAVDAENGSIGRIVLDLSHAVTYNVATQDTDSGTDYIITIDPPTAQAQMAAAPAGSLAGKIICVDPGHGGKDTGAPGIGGLLEKNFALAIGKELRQVLEADGAKVVMTRSDDTFIPLTTRAKIGMDAHADYYVSIHCDSADYGRNSLEGSTVYYHGDNATSRSLARSISVRLSQLEDGIRADGIKTDYIRFPGIGFAVLRHSLEPAVLVETGYMNSDTDIKALQNPQVRHEIAEGIAAGLADFAASRVADNN